MIALLYRIAGLTALALGAAGLFLPLLPTVPFVLLAAYCFARGSPAWEAWLLAHPRLGPPIALWRARGAIGRRGKAAALAAFAASALAGLLFLPMPFALIPVAAATVGGGWIASRPNA